VAEEPSLTTISEGKKGGERKDGVFDQARSVPERAKAGLRSGVGDVILKAIRCYLK